MVLLPIILFAVLLPIPLLFLSLGSSVQSHWMGYIVPMAVVLPLVALLARSRSLSPHLHWAYMAERGEKWVLDWRAKEIQHWRGKKRRLIPLPEIQEVLIRDKEKLSGFGKQRRLIMWREVQMRRVGNNRYLVLFSTEPMNALREGNDVELKRSFHKDTSDQRLARHFIINLGRALGNALKVPCTEDLLYD